VTEKEGREEFGRIVKIEVSGIVHGPGRREIDWNDTLQSVATRLEAFADEFERLAQGPEQKIVADKFSDFVNGFIHERLSMESLGELWGQLEAFEMEQIDSGLAGGLTELGESAALAWEKWMEPGLKQKNSMRM
jgi:hypothetical protein